MNIENASSGLVSLDGCGGKYSSSWLHYYLFEPQVIFPESKKVGRKHLFNTPLREDQMSPQYTSNEKSEYWEKLLSEADSLSDELMVDGRAAYRTEVLALISYLQGIPASRKRIELDSIQYSEYLNELELWNHDDLDSSSVNFAISNYSSMVDEGSRLFQKNCTVCHGSRGEGSIGPDLTDEYWLHGNKKTEIAGTIINGARNGMPSWKDRLELKEIGQLVLFIYSVRGSDPPNAKAPEGTIE